MDFLKKHYEKIVLCVILLGLAAAVLWMRSSLEKVKEEVNVPPPKPPAKTAPPAPMDLKPYEAALAQVTNPPPVVLSGAHNLFNPVTWKRKYTGELIKIILTGADALGVTNIIPLYTIITYERPTEDSYYIGIQRDVDLHMANLPRMQRSYFRKDEKKKNWPFIVHGTRSAETGTSEINLEMIDTGNTNVWLSTNAPYKQVDSYLTDLKYDPDPTLSLLKKKVGDGFKLDGEPYKIVAITNDAVSVKAERTTKVTVIKWTKSP